VLGTGREAPIDLLLLLDRHRLRAGSGAASLLPFEVSGRFTVAADGPDGSLAILDADRGALWLSRAEATAAVMHLLRVPDLSSRVRFTLARRRDRAGAALSLAGYSAASGELYAADLDLGRAEVGPIGPLARLETLAGGVCPRATHRIVVELPIHLRIAGAEGDGVLDQQVTASALLDAGPDQVCLVAVEAVLNPSVPVVLRATLGAGASASVWSEKATARGVCTVEKRR
jgi:hypothetical protein